MVRVRIAPSPTGNLHIGTAQTALFNWLFARKNKGRVFLRFEDTDKERSTKEFEKSICESLKWLGIKWDGEPVIQSQNLARHTKALKKLLNEGKAFYCHHSKEELEEERKDQETNKLAPLHICSYKGTAKSKEAGGIIRLVVSHDSDRIISFDDQIRGEVQFKESLLGDFSIARSINDSLYHFAVVVDDIDMEITHVLRGEDHISNTPKHLLIYEALGAKPPVFAHLPLILAPDRSKLSKRHGATSIIDYKKDYLPEALVNFLGGLSYTFSKDIISMEEMISEFELEKVHKSGAIFDVKKLNWVNSQYEKRLAEKSPAKFWEFSGFPGVYEVVGATGTTMVSERLEKMTEIKDFSYLWEDKVEYNKELLKWRKSTLEKSLETLAETGKILEKFDFKKGKDELRKILDDFSSRIGDRGLVYWPLRVALTGKEKSPDPIDIAYVLGKEKTLKRVSKAVKA